MIPKQMHFSLSVAESVQSKLFLMFLFLSFRHVLNVIYSFLGNSPVSEF